jgi:hypothetical protein
MKGLVGQDTALRPSFLLGCVPYLYVPMYFSQWVHQTELMDIYQLPALAQNVSLESGYVSLSRAGGILRQSRWPEVTHLGLAQRRGFQAQLGP